MTTGKTSENDQNLRKDFKALTDFAYIRKALKGNKKPKKGT